MRAVVAVDGHRGARLAAELADEGVAIAAVVEAHALASAPAAFVTQGVDVVILEARADTLTPAVVTVCVAHGMRLVTLCDDEAMRARVHEAGLESPRSLDAEGWALADVLAAPAAVPPASVAAAPLETADAVARGPLAPRGEVIAVWGPHGAPGRSTLAVEIAAELSRGSRSVALVDADAHAPSIALTLGIADEGPGFAAACRQAELGGLDPVELARISTPVRAGTGGFDVLVGINRPGRWPELSASRVAAALAACRAWAGHTVVDVAASLESDEEIVSDLDGPRRNAATLAALAAADTVVAVLSADPVGVARFLRAHAELRAIVGATRVVVVANRLRPGALGIDARGQVRRTLERFAGVEEVWFVPLDPRSVDSALLAARPVAETSPRSPLSAAVRRIVGESLVPPPLRQGRRSMEQPASRASRRRLSQRV